MTMNNNYASVTLTMISITLVILSFAWDLSLGIVRLGSFAWDISLGNFRLGTFAWELVLKKWHVVSKVSAFVCVLSKVSAFLRLCVSVHGFCVYVCVCVSVVSAFMCVTAFSAIVCLVIKTASKNPSR